MILNNAHMNVISLNILPSAESNDHQVRILIDGNDVLGNAYLGIDPPIFFALPNLCSNGQLLIGRCTCGCEGCDNFLVDVRVSKYKVIWINNKLSRLIFNRCDYENTIKNAVFDTSWEDSRRRAERLCLELFKNTKTRLDFKFNWASARIKQNVIVLSYSKNRDQVLFEFNWDDQTENSVLISANRFLKDEVVNSGT